MVLLTAFVATPRGSPGDCRCFPISEAKWITPILMSAGADSIKVRQLRIVNLKSPAVLRSIRALPVVRILIVHFHF